MFYSLFAVAALSPGYPTLAQETRRIVEGDATVVGEVPFIVSIQGVPDPNYPDETGYDLHFCGGMILDEFHILTAAHCFLNTFVDEVQVDAGVHDLRETGQAIAVKRAYPHPDFDYATDANDIAVLELASPITFDDNVKAIGANLAKADDTMDPGMEFLLAGWGNTNDIGTENAHLGEYPFTLLSAKQHYIETELCKTAFNEHNAGLLDESIICALGEQTGRPNEIKDHCHGDSGGPLYTKQKDGTHKLWGVVSWGSEMEDLTCGHDGVPGVYTRVSHYADFIEKILAGTYTDVVLEAGDGKHIAETEEYWDYYNAYGPGSEYYANGPYGQGEDAEVDEEEINRRVKIQVDAINAKNKADAHHKAQNKLLPFVIVSFVAVVIAMVACVAVRKRRGGDDYEDFDDVESGSEKHRKGSKSGSEKQRKDTVSSTKSWIDDERRGRKERKERGKQGSRS